jgi:hypothetical protein
MIGLDPNSVTVATLIAPLKLIPTEILVER